VKDLTVISNNAGVDDFGLGLLLQTRQIKRMVSSYVGENKEFERQYLAGELELEFNPQGTLAERIRAGGAGIPASSPPPGVGTLVAEGKEVREFDGRRYVMETALKADLSIVKAWKADEAGNLSSARRPNFNPMMATAGKVTVAEVEEVVPVGALDADAIHTPGIFVQRMIRSTPGEADRATHRAAEGGGLMARTREQLAERAAAELQDGFYVNLGIGIPTLVANFIPNGMQVTCSRRTACSAWALPLRGEEDADLINAGKQTITELPQTATSAAPTASP
jgi:3-oxoacid CoA-transferase